MKYKNGKIAFFQDKESITEFKWFTTSVKLLIETLQITWYENVLLSDNERFPFILKSSNLAICRVDLLNPIIPSICWNNLHFSRIANHHIADRLHTRNTIEVEIAKTIGRRAEHGHIGEYIASLIFYIALEDSANHPGIDGFIRFGPLTGKSVNVKTYGKREAILDIQPKYLPDYYLVLVGPKTAATISKGTISPWGIDVIFLCEANPLVRELRNNNLSTETATSVRNFYWECARIYPVSSNLLLQLSKSQQNWIRLFKGIDNSR